MGLYMITIWYPPHKAPEMAKIFVKQPKEFEHVKKWRAFITGGGLDGLKQYHLIYTDRDKMEEALGELNK